MTLLNRRDFLVWGLGAAVAATTGCSRAPDEIAHFPDPFLRKVCAVVDQFDNRLLALADRLQRAAASKGGFGLAAPQIHISQRVVFARLHTHPTLLVNPVILSREGTRTVSESCLSLPDQPPLSIERAETVVVAYQEPDGTRREQSFRGQAACVIQHEVDHLDGILYIDYA